MGLGAGGTNTDALPQRPFPISLVFDRGGALDRQGELLDLPLPRLHVVGEVRVDVEQLLLESVVAGAQEVDGLHAGLDRPHVVFLQCSRGAVSGGSMASGRTGFG